MPIRTAATLYSGKILMQTSVCSYSLLSVLRILACGGICIHTPLTPPLYVHVYEYANTIIFAEPTLQVDVGVPIGVSVGVGVPMLIVITVIVLCLVYHYTKRG